MLLVMILTCFINLICSSDNVSGQALYMPEISALALQQGHKTH